MARQPRTALEELQRQEQDRAVSRGDISRSELLRRPRYPESLEIPLPRRTTGPTDYGIGAPGLLPTERIRGTQATYDVETVPLDLWLNPFRNRSTTIDPFDLRAPIEPAIVVTSSDYVSMSASYPQFVDALRTAAASSPFFEEITPMTECLNLQDYLASIQDAPARSINACDSLYFSMMQYGVIKAQSICSMVSSAMLSVHGCIRMVHTVGGGKSADMLRIVKSYQSHQNPFTIHLQNDTGAILVPARSLILFNYSSIPNYFRIVPQGVRIRMPLSGHYAARGLLVIAGRAWWYDRKDIHRGLIPKIKELPAEDVKWLFTQGVKDLEPPSRKPDFNEADVKLPNGRTIKVRSPRSGMTNMTFK